MPPRPANDLHRRPIAPKVVALRPGRPPSTQAVPSSGNLADIDADYTVVVRSFVNSAVRRYLQGGGKLGRLAQKANLGTATVSRLAYYETARPTWHTVMATITALESFKEFAELTQRFAEGRR